MMGRSFPIESVSLFTDCGYDCLIFHSEHWHGQLHPAVHYHVWHYGFAAQGVMLNNGSYKFARRANVQYKFATPTHFFTQVIRCVQKYDFRNLACKDEASGRVTKIAV